MSKKIEMEWQDFGIKVSINVRDEENLDLCAKLWQALPFETVPMPSMSPGEMLCVPIPVTLPSVGQKEVLLAKQPPGTVVSSRMGLFIKYGIIVEPFSLPIVGVIPNGDLERLQGITPKLIEAYFFTKKAHLAIARKYENRRGNNNG